MECGDLLQTQTPWRKYRTPRKAEGRGWKAGPVARGHEERLKEAKSHSQPPPISQEGGAAAPRDQPGGVAHPILACLCGTSGQDKPPASAPVLASLSTWAQASLQALGPVAPLPPPLPLHLSPRTRNLLQARLSPPARPTGGECVKSALPFTPRVLVACPRTTCATGSRLVSKPSVGAVLAAACRAPAGTRPRAWAGPPRRSQSGIGTELPAVPARTPAAGGRGANCRTPRGNVRG